MINLYNMDCLEAMRGMEDDAFDLAIVDPPYGFGDSDTKILNFRHDEQHKNWNTAPRDNYFIELMRVSKNQIIWGGNYFPFIWSFGGRCFIYWHKGNPVSNFADGELAWTSFNQNARQFDYRYYGNHCGESIHKEPKFHPTQKPVALYTWLLSKYAKEGDRILDTHLGSGSIAIACHNLGFDLVGYELDEDYFQAAKKRLEEHQKQLRLF